MSEDIEMRKPKEHYETKEINESKEIKERKLEQEKQKTEKIELKKIKEKVPIEKISAHNSKNQKYILVLLGILCLALISSLFVDGKSKISTENQKEQTQYQSKNGNQNPDLLDTDVSNYQDDSQTFTDKFDMEQKYRDSENQRNLLINKARRQSLVGYTKNEPDDWKKKETVRILESRKSDFHFKVKPESFNNPEERINEIKKYESRENSIIKDKKYENVNSAEKENKYTEIEKERLLLIPTGTVISGVLDQDVNSDYIGQWLGHITHDVYSSDKEFILIPKGTKITGKTLHIGNINAPIQNRMGMTVEWAILPDGNRIDFRKADIEDQSGIHAIKDKVNRHLLWQFSGVAAYAMLNSETQQSNINSGGFGNSNSNNGDNFGFQSKPVGFSEQFRAGAKQQLNPMINKYLSLVPTVTIRAGTNIKILVKDDVYAKALDRVNNTIYK